LPDANLLFARSANLAIFALQIDQIKMHLGFVISDGSSCGRGLFEVFTHPE
jgi:hypothetical protein